MYRLLMKHTIKNEVPINLIFDLLICKSSSIKPSIDMYNSFSATNKNCLLVFEREKQIPVCVIKQTCFMIRVCCRFVKTQE